MKKITQNNAIRVSRQKNDTVERKLRQYRTLSAEVLPHIQRDKLRITPLGGQDGVGEKNMIVVEYGNDALVLDCGFELGIDLPGINYAIPVTDYLASIQHKLRGYVISHGHMDHIGALIHVVPKFPAPIFGSRFTIGMVGAQFEKMRDNGELFTPDLQVMDMDSHEQVRLGELIIELVRVTHAIPESSAIVVDTPVGRLINTGDFRLDPEPLDAMPSDIARLKELGDEGVLLLMSESTNATQKGRTPTEHTLQDSFEELIGGASGRVFVAAFSTNMNRIQMIIDTAHRHGRKVALDGRSMIATAELAVRLGNLKIPKGSLVPMREAINLPDKEVVIVCTGGQGEPGAAMSRMATGEHKYINLKRGDSVVISSTPIPGNERSYQEIGNRLALIGVKQFRHPTHELDGSGPLHVSGHGNRDEHTEMIRLTRPRNFMPIYGGALHREYHRQVALKEGVREEAIVMVSNGTVVELGSRGAPRMIGQARSGALLVDQTGEVVPEIVTKDRLLLRDDGFLVVVVTIEQQTGRLLGSPDIITRGCMAINDNPQVVDQLRQQARSLVRKRRLTSKTAISLLRNDLKTTASSTVFTMITKTPVVIPVINIIGARRTNITAKPEAETC